MSKLTLKSAALHSPWSRYSTPGRQPLCWRSIYGGTMKSEPEDSDVYAGRMLHVLRSAKGVTQEELAEQIGVTFQQIQKYERANNRMAVSTVHRICRALAVAPETFFPPGDVEPQSLPNGIQQEELSRLIRSYCRITDGRERQRALGIVRVYAGDSVMGKTLSKS